ncbi:hypothetical protein G7046_g6244 [Stylonectria norvegica]|nr:hypothetical protein G7046_g6244 [Stylonectria norvegica]
MTMSKPIDIPAPKSRQPRPFLETCIFPEDEGPYLGYIEIFESGHIYRALSTGSGKFAEVSSRCPVPTLSFIIEKDRLTKRVTLDIVSLNLRQAVSHAILSQPSSSALLNIEFNTVLTHYEALKTHLQRLRTLCPLDDVTMEMRLLVEDLLLERTLYDGIGIEVLRQRQILCDTHLQDIHARSISIGLNDIEVCFSLGQVPDEIDQQYLEALDARYAELARSGDYTELRNLCEPVVRSGEIELPYNPSLLLDVLNNGHLDVYQYMLDLVDRTKHTSMDVVGAQYPDITFDPLYVAIRLGQLDAVRSFVSEHATFEGCTFEDVTANHDRIFTPILAAVYWKQADIISLLLNSGPFYHAALPQATALALEGGSDEILQIVLGYHQQPSPTMLMGSMFPAATYSQPQFYVSPQALQYSVAPTAPSSLGAGRSVSGITNGLFGMDCDIPLEANAFESTTSTTSANLNDPSISFSRQAVETSYAFPPSVFSKSQPMDLCISPAHHQTHMDVDSLHEPVLTSVPTICHTSNRKIKRSLGRDFMTRLDERCAKLKALCAKHPGANQYECISSCFDSAGNVWKSGIHCFRQITKNKAPSGIGDVLRGLLVADALSCQIPHGGGDLQLEFLNDLGRWRTVLDVSEQVLFDEIARAVWGLDNVPAVDTPKCAPDELNRFQDLIQNVVSVENNVDKMPSKPAPFGARLRSVQKRVEDHKANETRTRHPHQQTIPPNSSFQSIGSVLGKLTKDTDSYYDDNIVLSDFVHLDAFECDEPLNPMPKPRSKQKTKPAGPQDMLSKCHQRKNIRPIVVFLLASVAFSVVLTAVTSIQDGPESYRSTPFRRAPPGYGRSCTIVEDFLNFKADDSSTYDSGVDLRPPADDQPSPWVWEMKEAGRKNSRLRKPGEEMSANSPSLAAPASISSQR